MAKVVKQKVVVRTKKVPTRILRIWGMRREGPKSVMGGKTWEDMQKVGWL